MKRVIVRVVVIVVLLGVLAAAAMVVGYKLIANEEHTFTLTRQIAVTPVRNQGRTRLCWAFSGVALIEADMLRQGRGECDFSEMDIAYRGYQQRALHRSSTFDPGGCCGDFVSLIYKGVMPDTCMPCPAQLDHRHIKPLIQALPSSHPQGAPLEQGKEGLAQALKRILDDSIGVRPDSFEVGGIRYTPRAYADTLGINADDYIQLTSFSHHPFYRPFAIECPDNWRQSPSYNLPIDELMAVVDTAISQGYALCWEGDISEYGFRLYNRKGFVKRLGPWQQMVSQRQRQRAWECHRTTDDHVMLICGMGHDEHGRDYYLVKNCWGQYGPYGGFVFMSKAYARYKVVSILVHRDAVPSQILNKLNITR